MKLLALDTSSMVATVAIMEDERLLAETILNHKKTHSVQLMPLVKELMDNCGVTPEEIDYFAVSLGPGSFTGLRIGVTTIKAMAQALDKPVVGISTLDALAFNLPYGQGVICPIVDAQRDNVYTARYKWDKGVFKKISNYEIVNIEELIELLSKQDEDVIFVGDGLNLFKPILAERLQDKAIFPYSAIAIPRASSVATLALQKIEEGLVERAEEIIPIYMRKSQAENQFEEKMRGR